MTDMAKKACQQEEEEEEEVRTPDFSCASRLRAANEANRVSQEDILITSEDTASHSGTLRMFSGNSLVAETRLQTSLVSMGANDLKSDSD